MSSPSSPRVTVRAAKKKFVPFDPDKFLQNFVDKARAAAAGLSRVDALKQELMSSVTLAKGSDTLEAEERVRRVFQELEKAAPSSPQLLLLLLLFVLLAFSDGGTSVKPDMTSSSWNMAVLSSKT